MADDKPEKLHPAYETNPPPLRKSLGVDIYPPMGPRAPERATEAAQATPVIVERGTSPGPDTVTTQPKPPMDAETKAAAKAMGAHWTPGSIAAAVAIIITSLGGVEGVRQILGSAAETQRQITALRKEVMARADEQAQLESRERAKIQAAITELKEQSRKTADLAAQLNGGPPDRSWPYRVVAWEPQPPNGGRIPAHQTYAPWDSD